MKTCYPFYEERIRRWKQRAADRFEEGEIWECGVGQDLEDSLYETLHRIAVRTLIAQMYVCKEEGVLGQGDSRQQYEKYLAWLGTKENRERIEQEYPVLKQLLDEAEENQMLFWQETGERIAADWKNICALFGEKETKINRIEKVGSDLHQGGKCVLRIGTKAGWHIYYKPHGLGNEAFWQALLEKMDPQYARIGTLVYNRGAYGWMKEIRQESCGSEAEVRRFYQRMGRLAAAAWLIGMGDLHYENLIAHGEFPVIVDAETLFQHTDAKGFYSVLTSGLFPGGGAGYQVAGITGGRGGTYGNTVPVILYDKTADMQIAYRKPEIKQGKNVPVRTGKQQNPQDFQKEIAEGFEQGWSWICANREWIRTKIGQHEKTLWSRHISGGTQFFGLAVIASYHPSLLKKEGDREAYLARILRNRPLAQEEAKAMRRGDIPWFYRKMDTSHLYGESGAVELDFFARTTAEAVESRLAKLRKEDAVLQQSIWKLSLAVWKNGQDGWENAIAAWEKERAWTKAEWILAAQQIGDRIWQMRMGSEENRHWLSPVGEESYMQLLPTGMQYYDGLAGIAVFYRALWTTDGTWEERCRILEQQLFSYTDRRERGEISAAEEGNGMYCGETSLIYAYQQMYELTKEGVYLTYAQKQIRLWKQEKENAGGWELLYGIAGAVVLLCRQYEWTKELQLLQDAEELLQLLDRNRQEEEGRVFWNPEKKKNPICSMAHGNSGNLLAYAKVHALRPREEYRERMKQITACEDAYWSETAGNWADLKKEENCFETYAWCHGGVGVVWARIQAWRWNPRETWLLEGLKDKAPRLLQNLPLRKGMCLCHGNMGNYLILQAAADLLGEEALRRKAEQRRRQLAAMLESGSLLPQEQYTAGLLTGLAGIGLGCLLIAKLPQE